MAGAFTLAIMILPLIMRTTEEALKSVPDSYREGSFGLGAGKLRTVFRVVLPSAVPGILAGVIWQSAESSETANYPTCRNCTGIGSQSDGFGKNLSHPYVQPVK